MFFPRPNDSPGLARTVGTVSGGSNSTSVMDLWRMGIYNGHQIVVCNLHEAYALWEGVVMIIIMPN